ncbi:MFS efflux pump atnC [Colletotrichum sp. SAR11_240]|nr:MFS efflux pump atnC [Colletotrichum sp. SAR11_240]
MVPLTPIFRIIGGGNRVLVASLNSIVVDTVPPSSVFESTGYGIGQALQGTLASFANPSSTGELFAGAALIELLAGLSGTFAFAGLFDLGLQSKFARGVGLPYFVAAILYAIAVIESLSL